MGLLKEAIQIGVGSVLLAVFLKVGIIQPSGNFWHNVLAGAVIMVASRAVAWFLRG
jgi:hypothetical protein